MNEILNRSYKTAETTGKIGGECRVDKLRRNGTRGRKRIAVNNISPDKT